MTDISQFPVSKLLFAAPPAVKLTALRYLGGNPAMRHHVPRPTRRSRVTLSMLLVSLLFAAPIRGQQTVVPASQKPEPRDQLALDNLLAVDAYKLYGEVRSVGQLLSTGGAGEIVDPIIKLVDPGKEFKSIVSFLKKNSEALASSRLIFATWPARTDVPNVLVAIEFPTDEEAAKFSPKLETFLPTILPPVPVAPEAS